MQMAATQRVRIPKSRGERKCEDEDKYIVFGFLPVLSGMPFAAGMTEEAVVSGQMRLIGGVEQKPVPYPSCR